MDTGQFRLLTLWVIDQDTVVVRPPMDMWWNINHILCIRIASVPEFAEYLAGNQQPDPPWMSVVTLPRHPAGYTQAFTQPSPLEIIRGGYGHDLYRLRDH